MAVPLLNILWGIDGLQEAIRNKTNVVIIDQSRFSSTVVTAVANGFVIEPTAVRANNTTGFSLSPSTFLNKKPRRVTIASKNGAVLSVNAKDAKKVVYGSILNAKAVARWINEINEDTVLLAAGEWEPDRHMNPRELEMSNGNKIFCIEDFAAAGAISYFSKIEKTEECLRAEEIFSGMKDNLLDNLKKTTSHIYNEERGRGMDTSHISRLNIYDIVPKLTFVKGVPEIK